LAKSADSPSFVVSGPWHSKTAWNIVILILKIHLDTLCVNMVNFGPVTPEFNRVKGVHPLVDQQFDYAATLLDLPGSVLSFLGRSVFSFVSVIR